MLILLTNDDGIYAPGLMALAEELRQLGDVEVAAPARDQSGVSHSITYLQPLIVQEAFQNDRHFGWEVAGSPADCVKLAISRPARRRAKDRQPSSSGRSLSKCTQRMAARPRYKGSPTSVT